jgi:hypothetical protein
MIDKLTDKQEREISIYRERWMAIGKSCTQIDREKASGLIVELYKYMDMKPPKIIFCDSPFACRKEFRERSREADIEWFYGQHHAYWMGYYDYFYNELGFKVDDVRFYELVKNLIIETHWMIPCETECIVSERPEYICVSNNVLHADGKPAIRYKDGFAVWALNGVRVTQEIAETPAGELDPKIIFREKNVEARREIVRKIGNERIFETLNAKVVDTWMEYSLLKLKIDSFDISTLRMKNPSTGTWHCENVPETCRTVKDALAWRDGEEEYEMPVVLT